jgi:hypothetical protein
LKFELRSVSRIVLGAGFGSFLALAFAANFCLSLRRVSAQRQQQNVAFDLDETQRASIGFAKVGQERLLGGVAGASCGMALEY